MLPPRNGWITFAGELSSFRRTAGEIECFWAFIAVSRFPGVRLRLPHFGKLPATSRFRAHTRCLRRTVSLTNRWSSKDVPPAHRRRPYNFVERAWKFASTRLLFTCPRRMVVSNFVDSRILRSLFVTERRSSYRECTVTLRDWLNTYTRVKI